MGQQDTTEAKIAEKHVTKITGQPTDRDLTLLRKELVKIAGKEATSLGGGKHGHIGTLMKETDYKEISNGGVELGGPAQNNFNLRKNPRERVRSICYFRQTDRVK